MSSVSAHRDGRGVVETVWFTGTGPQLLSVQRPAFRKAASPWRGHFEGTGVHIIMRPVSSHMQSLCVCVSRGE